MNERPNPDQLLAAVQTEEQQRTRGKLTIFLGYAAGVGKTFAMLSAAHQRKAEGVEVVIGYIETHKRAETEALVAGLETVPRKPVEYRGTSLPEMDLDAVLARQPQLALVDEFAHTNAPGSRHPKRYQDVLELLDAGIDVYTTLNIQHLDSLNDVVAQITGVVVRETLPDRVLDECADIKLIDLPPDELLQRLAEGKVYVPEQAARAIEKFFRKGNLTALREMTLRRAAERVDDQMRAYMQTRAIPGPWKASERLMVCVSPSTLSERLVRSARRLADELNAEWFAVYVEASGNIAPAEHDRMVRTLQLAEELGAKALTLPGRAVAEVALNYARQHNITKIIVGKPLRPRWQELLFGSVVEHLIQHSGPIDVYVISGSAETISADGMRRAWLPNPPYNRYGLAVGLVAVFTASLAPFANWLLPTNSAMLYLALVVGASLYLGRGPSVVISALSALCFNFFFVPPLYTFAITDTQYVFTFFGLFLAGLIVSSLGLQVREQAEVAQRRAAETAELYDLSRDLTVAASHEEIAQTVLHHVQQTFGREAVVLLPHGNHLVAHTVGADFEMNDNERAVADWVFRNGEAAGRNTNTLTAARLRYLPLKTARGVVGVLGVTGPTQAERHLSPDRRRLMESFASQIALAIERSQLSEAAQQTQVLQATEKLQTALLNAVSHDLRTPLVSITGALSSLQDKQVQSDEQARQALVENASEEAARLNRLVGNLLDMTRLESGAYRLKREPCDVQDLIGAALAQLNDRLIRHTVNVTIEENLPLVPLDFVPMTQVLVNLIDNALKYSPPQQPIEIQARLAGTRLQVSVADQGPGVPPDDVTRVFDKFYRAHRPDNVSGSGLGLSICKGIVEAHGGRIRVENRMGGGAHFEFDVPVSEG